VGTVRLDDSAEKLAGTELTFDIVPVDHIWPWPEGIRATTDKQGRIQFDGVHEGEYWLFPIRLPNGSYVEKIRYGVVPANSSVIRVLNSSAMLEIEPERWDDIRTRSRVKWACCPVLLCLHRWRGCSRSLERERALCPGWNLSL
jgi:hypothetical protein